jgi:hypothetical protein
MTPLVDGEHHPELMARKQIDRMRLRTVIIVVTAAAVTLTSALAGLNGLYWHSEQDYISAHGRLELTSRNKVCTFIDKLDCKVSEPAGCRYIIF